MAAVSGEVECHRHHAHHSRISGVIIGKMPTSVVFVASEHRRENQAMVHYLMHSRTLSLARPDSPRASPQGRIEVGSAARPDPGVLNRHAMDCRRVEPRLYSSAARSSRARRERGIRLRPWEPPDMEGPILRLQSSATVSIGRQSGAQLGGPQVILAPWPSASCPAR